MTYILLVVFYTFGMNPSYSVSEMSSKNSCETALVALKNKKPNRIVSVECIEVKK